MIKGKFKKRDRTRMTPKEKLKRKIFDKMKKPSLKNIKLCSVCKIKRKSKFHHHLCDKCWGIKQKRWEALHGIKK